MKPENQAAKNSKISREGWEKDPGFKLKSKTGMAGGIKNIL